MPFSRGCRRRGARLRCGFYGCDPDLAELLDAVGVLSALATPAQTADISEGASTVLSGAFCGPSRPASLGLSAVGASGRLAHADDCEFDPG